MFKCVKILVGVGKYKCGGFHSVCFCDKSNINMCHIINIDSTWSWDWSLQVQGFSKYFGWTKFSENSIG